MGGGGGGLGEKRRGVHTNVGIKETNISILMTRYDHSLNATASCGPAASTGGACRFSVFTGKTA